MEKSEAEAPQVYGVAEEEAGQRLDAFLAGVGNISRSHLQTLIKEGHVQVNGAAAKPSARVRTGDTVRVALPPIREIGLVAEDIPLEIIYEDNHLLVVNKPPGMVVHPSAGHGRGTLVNALLPRLQGAGGVGGALRPGIVHRLDKDTSGLLAVAKDDLSHQALSAQLKDRTMKREYLALVHGRPPMDYGTLEGDIGRHPTQRLRMAVVENGRPAATDYRLEEKFKDYSLLRLSLRSGRTHQIRVHLAAWGFPVVGDMSYAQRSNPFGMTRQALHAVRLVLHHPVTGAEMTFHAPLPADFQGVLDQLRNSGAS